MEMKFVPVRGQSFDLGRTINPMKCFSDCNKSKTCQSNRNFLDCKNYVPKTKRKKYKVSEFIDAYREELRKGWTDELISDLCDDVISFPKGLFWLPDRGLWDDEITSIKFITFSQLGRERCVGSISLKDYVITDFFLNQTQEKFLSRVRNILVEIDSQNKTDQQPEASEV